MVATSSENKNRQLNISVECSLTPLPRSRRLHVFFDQMVDAIRQRLRFLI